MITPHLNGHAAAVSSDDLKPSEALRALLAEPGTSSMMSAHDALSAKIAVTEGIPAVWASGFSLSSALGVRDSSELTASDLVAAVDRMTDAVAAPVLVDGDTGFGNFNNARQLVRKLCKVRAAGLCIEDKLFPKMNSFASGSQELIDSDEMSGKISACKEAQTDPEFCLVARTEALICGLPVAEAIERASAYRDAGADAIFIHSKSSDADEVLTFADLWDFSIPLVVSPTTYPAVSIAELSGAGISLAIWSNQTLRAAVFAMRAVCRAYVQGSGFEFQDSLASIAEIFELFDYDELREAEARFLP
ncbi:MAG: isocitrate lyase/phosphoenolpyruvate mutase family protein [Solirubrobacterales bacterium]